MSTSLRSVVISRRTPEIRTPVVFTISTTCATAAGPAEMPPAAAADEARPARAGGVARLGAADTPRVRGDAAPLPGECRVVPANKPARGCCDAPAPMLALPPSATDAPEPAAVPPAPGVHPRRVRDGIGGEQPVVAAPRRFFCTGKVEVSPAIDPGNAGPGAVRGVFSSSLALQSLSSS